MLLAYSFSGLDNTSRSTFLRCIEYQLQSTSISYEIKTTPLLQVWVSNQNDVEKTREICRNIHNIYKKEVNADKYKLFTHIRRFSSTGITTFLLLGITLFLGIRLNFTRNEFLSIPASSIQSNKIIPTLAFEPNPGQPSNLEETTSWIGLYNIFMKKNQDPNSLKNYHPRLFAAISEGQIWRLFTPSLLNISFLSLLFNCFWFGLLGYFIEIKVGKIKFLFFILFLGIVSNVLQYIMTGAHFYGLSGIICGFAGFILVRKTNAPWEAYPVKKETLYFLVFCIAASLVLESILTLALLSGKSVPVLNVPNTLLVTGFLFGFLIGKTKILRISSRI